jgi:Tfp pilus assembly protein PilN
MFTFLPYEEKQIVAREYRKKLLLIYVALVMFAGIAWIASLVPSYILVSLNRDEAIAQKQSPISDIGADAVSLTEKELAIAQEKLFVLTPLVSRQPISFVLTKLFSRIPHGVTISSITMNRSVTKGMVVVSGIATTREVLVSFAKALEGEAFFKKVELPVSNFTKGKDVPFSISLNASF